MREVLGHGAHGVRAMAAASAIHGEGISRAQVMAFAARASMEIAPHDEALLPVLADKLPAGTTLYVAQLPKTTLAEAVRVAIRARSLGFKACPHIIARRLTDEHELRSALAELREAGVEQVLLVAGDCPQPAGKFESTVDVIESGVLTESGIGKIGFGAHPEGHKLIGPARLEQALKRKQEFARQTGIKVHLLTQFGFNPHAVNAWVAHLSMLGVELPIHVGIAGPTPLPKLIRFAMQCGIGPSMRALMRNVSVLGNLTRPAVGPDEMLVGALPAGMVREHSRVVQPHFFAFGGAMATATWLRSVQDGHFEISPDGTGLLMHP